MVEAAHPVPDVPPAWPWPSVLELVSNLNEDDRVIFLLPVAASGLLALPAAGITPGRQAGDQQGPAQVRRDHRRDELRAQAPLRHQGRRLGKACWPATVYTYAISDMPHLATVNASGPTVGQDPSTSGQALDILKRYAIEVPASVRNWLQSPNLKR